MNIQTRVRGDVQPKSSIPIGAKVEISAKGFTRGFTQVEIEKNLFNLPHIINKCWTLWPCIGPKAEKKGYHPIWEANLQPLGPMFSHLLIS